MQGQRIYGKKKVWHGKVLKQEDKEYLYHQEQWKHLIKEVKPRQTHVQKPSCNVSPEDN